MAFQMNQILNRMAKIEEENQKLKNENDKMKNSVDETNFNLKAFGSDLVWF